jgi:hypothetical protein
LGGCARDGRFIERRQRHGNRGTRSVLRRRPRPRTWSGSRRVGDGRCHPFACRRAAGRLRPVCGRRRWICPRRRRSRSGRGTLRGNRLGRARNGTVQGKVLQFARADGVAWRGLGGLRGILGKHRRRPEHQPGRPNHNAQAPTRPHQLPLFAGKSRISARAMPHAHQLQLIQAQAG